MKESGYYPAGAEFDPSAPYNEELDVSHKRFVSLTISFYITVDGPENMSEIQIRDSIRKELEAGKLPDNFCVDELEVFED